MLSHNAMFEKSFFNLLKHHKFNSFSEKQIISIDTIQLFKVPLNLKWKKKIQQDIFEHVFKEQYVELNNSLTQLISVKY